MRVESERVNVSETIPSPWFPAQYALRKIDTISDKDKIVILRIIRKAYQYKDIKINMLNTRRRPLVETNSIISKVIKQYYNLPLAVIGKLFNKHHATILHYIESYEEVLCVQNKHKELFNYLVHVINENKYGEDEPLRVDSNSKTYFDLLNDYNELVVKYKTVKEQVIKIKSILDG
tara:strand:- start:1257 stop:1784 length:528 start_codon:yes stop_codon:yes gene_type:complete